MSRAFVRLWDAANAYLRQRGTAWIFSRISMFDPSSLAAHARLGVRPVDTPVFVRLRATELAFFSMAPYVHVSRSMSKRPVVTLQAPTHSGERMAR
jgi:hypothetical protein